MNYLSINDVKEIVTRDEKKALVLIWKDTGKTFGYWATDLLSHLNELAKKGVEYGEFETFDQAIEHLEKITSICTEEDFNTNQERLSSPS